MFTIRAEQEKDISSIQTVNQLAFGGDNEVKLVDAIRGSQFFIPELSLVAVNDDNEVIGHILFSVIHVETEAGVVPTLGLAPMAVLPEHQNSGVGSTLVREGLKKSTELGYEHVMVLGHPNFYPKFGFVPSRSKGIEPPFPVRDEVFMVLELTPDALRGIQGTVKYPPAFDAV